MNDFLIPIRTFIELGGPVVAVLFALSIFSLALIVLKLFVFFTQRVGHHLAAKQALELWHNNSKPQALHLMKKGSGALNKSLYVAMAQTSAGQKFKEDIEEDVSRLAVSKLHELQKGFRALDAIVQIAPLLGLFGTVIGMIDAFRHLQTAGNAVDPSLLAGGIWIALLTTAAGLAVAMPVSLILTWFETRLEDERVAIQTMTSEVLSNSTFLDADTTGDMTLTMEKGYAT